MKLCECGCGREVRKPQNRFIHNHHCKGENNSWYGVSRSGKNNPHYGRKHSEETKKKISKANTGASKGEKNFWYGKKGKDNPRYGKPLSQEHRQKISESNKGRIQPKGDKSSSWKGGRIGYCRKKAKEVMGLIGPGKGVSRYGIVHHVDGDISNNSIDNLMLLSASDHAKLHRLQERANQKYEAAKSQGEGC